MHTHSASLTAPQMPWHHQRSPPVHTRSGLLSRGSLLLLTGCPPAGVRKCSSSTHLRLAPRGPDSSLHPSVHGHSCGAAFIVLLLFLHTTAHCSHVSHHLWDTPRRQGPCLTHLSRCPVHHVACNRSWRNGHPTSTRQTQADLRGTAGSVPDHSNEAHATARRVARTQGFPVHKRRTGMATGFFRHKTWSRLPFPSSGDLLDPRMDPRSPAWQVDTLPSESPGTLPHMKGMFTLCCRLVRVQQHYAKKVHTLILKILYC